MSDTGETPFEAKQPTEDNDYMESEHSALEEVKEEEAAPEADNLVESFRGLNFRSKESENPKPVEKKPKKAKLADTNVQVSSYF